MNGKGAKRHAQWTVGLLLALAMVGVVLLAYWGFERAKVREQFADINDDRLKKETALVSELTNQIISLDAFRQQYTRIQVEAAAERSGVTEIYPLFEKTGELPEDPLDRAMVEYYDAFDEAKTDSGFLNFDALEDIMTELSEDVWTDAQLEHIERRTGGAEHTPLVQEFLDDRKSIEEIEYFEIAREEMQFNGLTAKHREYMRSSDKTAFRNDEENIKFDIVLGIIDGIREEKRRDNWEMEILLYKWG